jgi:hypothetical protein
MPLPDAPPTDQSRVYREFASKTALPGASGSITADLLDNFKNSLYLDEFSEDELRRLLLIQMATGAGSVSGPMPNTFKIEIGTTSSSGSIVTAFTPNAGEVWQIVGSISGSGSGTSGTITLEVKLYDIANSRRAEWISTATTTGKDTPLTETTHNPVYIDENCRIEVEATGTFTTYNFSIPMVRVR